MRFHDSKKAMTFSDSDKKKYVYRVEDRSLLLPFFRQFFWRPILQFIPKTISPNVLTICGNSFAWFSFLLIVLAPNSSKLVFLVSGLCIAAYITIDNLDGEHARRTDRASKLGEFLDHWFDNYSAALCVFGFALMLDLSQGFTLLGVGTVCWVSMITFWEHLRRGEVVLGFVGNIEAMTSIILTYASALIFGVETINQKFLFSYLSIPETLFLVMSIGVLVSLMSPIRRLRNHFSDLLAPSISFVLLVIWAENTQGPLLLHGLLLLLLGNYYAGKFVVARFGHQAIKISDPFLVMVLVLMNAAGWLFPLPQHQETILGCLLFLYLFARVMLEFFGTITTISKHFTM
ncbi:MAG: CDP-alcohol phosphatidyltransferase family protein [Myxococcales bacterium]|nr:MAG: CDP-alcohol phosphatidyltransferase family protein [Myxococcales bacterium]